MIGKYWTEKRNIRDLSYLTNAEGKKLKQGFFVRSANLYKAPRCIVKHLKGINLGTIIDLRTPSEREKKPDKELEGVTNLAIPVLREEHLGITHERGLKAYKKPPEMTKIYAKLVTDENSVKAYAEALQIIFDLNREGAVLWHCSAGKDRAGILSAIFLLVLGYKEEDVYADYELSHKHAEKWGRIYRFGVRLIGKGKQMADAVYRAMLAKPEYLQSALDAIKAHYGSYEGFFFGKLGLSKEKIAAFWDKYEAKGE